MKILIEDYQTGWVNDFLEEKEIISSALLDFNPEESSLALPIV